MEPLLLRVGVVMVAEAPERETPGLTRIVLEEPEETDKAVPAVMLAAKVTSAETEERFKKPEVESGTSTTMLLPMPNVAMERLGAETPEKLEASIVAPTLRSKVLAAEPVTVRPLVSVM